MSSSEQDRSAPVHPGRLRLGLQLAALSLLATTLGAQDSASSAPDSDAAVEDEVTVTAQRVEQVEQEVPISMLTVDGDDLLRQSIGDIGDLGASAPGLVVSGQASSTGEVALHIRGIGSNTFGLGTESTVGYYVDGVYMPRPQAFLGPYHDIERIEVLRGPQGTLWGRNSTGGAINVVTAAPETPLSGRIYGEAGTLDSPESADAQRLALALTGPLGDTLFGRLSAHGVEREDHTFNELLGRTVDTVDGWSLRGSVSYLPSDSVSLVARVDRTDHDSHNNFNLKAGDVSPLSTIGTLNRFYGFDEPDDVHRIAADLAPVSAYEESGASFTGEWSLGDGAVTLESISSYREYDSERIADVDATPLSFIENVGAFDSEWWSQELKLHGGGNRAEWIAGVYAFHEEGLTQVDNRTDFALFEVFFFASNPQLFAFDPSSFCSLGFLAPTFLCGIDYYTAIAPFIGLALPGNVSTGNFFVSDLETDSYSGYGQVYWRLTDRLTLTGGLRYTYDEKSHVQDTIDFVTQQPLRQSLEDDWDALTPKLGLEFRPNEDVMVYGSVTTGFKSGGFNSISLQPSFDEETITSYETGVKSDLAGGKARLNAALFHYDYDDLQVAVLFPDRSTVENAAEASVTGAELDLRLRPTPRLVLDLHVAALDDEYDRFSSQDPLEVAQSQYALNAQGVFDPVLLAQAAAAVPTRDLSGRGLQRAPDLSASASAEYTFSLGSAGELAARGQYVYTDDIAFDPFERLVQPSYELFHANLAWTPPGGSWWLNLYGRNLGDEEYVTNEIFVSFTGSLRVWAPPSEVGLQVGWRF